MIIIDLMIAILTIITITLLSGKKVMFNNKYFNIILIISIMYINLSNLILGYNLGHITIKSIIAFIAIALLIFGCGYKRISYSYSIHNVEESDLVNIIENYLDRKNIKSEVRSGEIYLEELNSNIYISNSIQINLDFKEINKADFYNELIKDIKAKIKDTNKKYFSLESVFYLIFTLFLLWIRFIVLK